MTLLLSTPSADPLLRSMIVWYADNQRATARSRRARSKRQTLTLFDYEAYWVEDVYDYVLYTGDISLAQQVWPNLEKLMDTWYPAQMGPAGFSSTASAPSDYAYIPRPGRRSPTTTPGTCGRSASRRRSPTGSGSRRSGRGGRRGSRRSRPRSGRRSGTRRSGAYRDSTVGPVVHPEDGNVFAVLAGLATPTQAVRRSTTSAGTNGSPTARRSPTTTSGTASRGATTPTCASTRSSRTSTWSRATSATSTSALALIRREWGYMLANGPKATMWETIGAYGGPPVGRHPSYDHGWSSGAAPALTDYALGVQPATRGSGRYVAEPHPADLKWARGTVPTPHGPIVFRWSRARHGFSATVSSPVPGKLILPDYGVGQARRRRPCRSSGA